MTAIQKSMNGALIILDTVGIIQGFLMKINYQNNNLTFLT